MQTRTPLLLVPVFIVLMGFVPMLSFGGRFFSWTQFAPFILIAVFACLIPAVFFGRFSRFRGGATGGEQLMDSIGEWLRTRAAS